MLNERGWNPRVKQDAIEAYDGEESQGYKTNVLAEEGEPMAGAWDIAQIHACMVTKPEDRHKPIVNRGFVKCPVTVVNGVRLKERIEEEMAKHIAGGRSKETARRMATDREIGMIDLPQDRDLGQKVVLAMDVGKQIHPSIIGIWGIDERRKPHLWGMLVLLKVDYEEQTEILKRVIERYEVIGLGIDATAADGAGIAEQLVRWKSEDDGLYIAPIKFNSTLEVPDTASSHMEARRRHKQTDDTRKLDIKYYATYLMRLRFQKMDIELLHDYGMMLEFQTEMCRQGQSSRAPETYYGPKGDHRIDMMRCLEILLLYMVMYAKVSRNRDRSRPMIDITTWQPTVERRIHAPFG